MERNGERERGGERKRKEKGDCVHHIGGIHAAATSTGEVVAGHSVSLQ